MTLETVLLSPPVAGALLFAVIYGLSRLLSHYAPEKADRSHITDAYACGQRGVKNYVSPDYSEFYPYVALFTLVHGLVLVVATVPKNVVLLPSAFILVGLGMLYVVFRKVR